MIDSAAAVIPDDAAAYSLLRGCSLIDGGAPDIVASRTDLIIKHKFCGTVKMNVTVAVRGPYFSGKSFPLKCKTCEYPWFHYYSLRLYSCTLSVLVISGEGCTSMANAALFNHQVPKRVPSSSSPSSTLRKKAPSWPSWTRAAKSSTPLQLSPRCSASRLPRPWWRLA